MCFVDKRTRKILAIFLVFSILTDFLYIPKIKAIPVSVTSEDSYIKVTPLLQNPSLPTGCEVTSLAILLDYYGISITKEELAEEYLPKGEIGKVNPNDYFVGSPYNNSSFGCYSGAIEITAKNYLSANNLKYTAVNDTGKDLCDLLFYLDYGTPIIVWTTIGLLYPYVSTTWNINGENVDWLANEHCVVLIGYDAYFYIVSDPLVGICKYPRFLFDIRYNQMGKQSLVILKS